MYHWKTVAVLYLVTVIVIVQLSNRKKYSILLGQICYCECESLALSPIE